VLCNVISCDHGQDNIKYNCKKEKHAYENNWNFLPPQIIHVPGGSYNIYSLNDIVRSLFLSVAVIAFSNNDFFR
jgi:hypothetical protein